MDTLEILYALIYEFNKTCPNVKNTLEQKESIAPPFFLHNISFCKDTQKSFFIKKTLINVSTIYIAKDENGGLSKLEHNLSIRKELLKFLDTYTLKVGNRFLHFNYEFKDLNGILGITISFEIIESIKNAEWAEEQKREIITQINFNNKEMI